jgi:hypothetical protein
MWDNKNMWVTNLDHHYMMQPGDATMYRFGFCHYPEDPEQAYVLDEGVGPNAREEYIKFWINMPSATGIGALHLAQLEFFPEHVYLIGYLQSPGHGFTKVNKYTIVAVLLALKVLVKNPDFVEEAAQAMMKARDVIMLLNTDGE